VTEASERAYTAILVELEVVLVLGTVADFGDIIYLIFESYTLRTSQLLCLAAGTNSLSVNFSCHADGADLKPMPLFEPAKAEGCWGEEACSSALRQRHCECEMEARTPLHF
jgi:hypothetical protein